MKEIINLRKPREKHFENGDGTITAQMYDHDIHFLKNGKYEEIDNTLIEKDNHYENKENEFKVIFDKDNSDLLDIHKEGHYLNISLKDKENLVLTKQDETIEYKDIENNIDIDYQLIGNKVKESIILKDKNNIPEYLEFIIDTNLELILKENGTIEASCNNNVIFIIDSAFMIDNKKTINRNISYELIKDNNKYNLKLTLDKEWLLDNKREYPVIIDPTIIANGEKNENVFDAYISSKTPDKNLNSEWYLSIGSTSDDIHRILLKFVLPTIGTGFNIVESKFFMTENYTQDIVIKRAEVHAINSNWDETSVTWNSINNKFDSKIESLYNMESFNNASFDITNLVKSWYAGKTNNGLMIKAVDETLNQGVIEFHSKTYDGTFGKTYRPYLTIKYIKQSGIRNDMTYTNISHTNGNTSINNYTGNLTNVFTLNKTISNKFPISIGIVYNTEDILLDESKIAKGWKFTLEESLEKVTIENREFLKFKDSSNGDFYFYKQEENKYKDEDGLNLTITFKDNIYEMIDSNGNKKIFTNINSKYLLTKIIDVELNEVNIIYTNDKITKIKDANNEEINITYSANLITLTSTYDTAKINISNNLITSIETKDGTTTFNYNTNNLISKIIDVDTTYVLFEYYNISPYKLHKVTNYGLNNEIGKTITFEYEANSTSITDNEERKTVYIFDMQGHTLNNIMYPKGVHKLRDAYVNENSYYVYPEFENQKNKLSSSNPAIKFVNNLLTNSGFERELNECNFTISSGCERRQGDRQESGEYSLLFPSNAELTYNIKEEDDYTLRFHLTMSRVDGREDASISLYMENNGVRTLIDNFYKESNKIYDLQEFNLEFEGHFLSNSKLILTCEHGEHTFMYLDNLYLEKGIVANIKNLVDNADFSNGTYGWDISCQDGSNDFYSVVDLPTGEKALKINNNPNKEYSASQNLHLIGKSGDTYRLSFWYKNEGIVELPSESEGVLVSLATFPIDTLNDGSCIPLSGLNCNSKEWQVFSGTFTAPYDYNGANLVILSLNEGNSFYITNVMIIKDPRKISYNYDGEGNLISTTELNNETTNLKYDENNQLISMFNPMGNNFKYEYDNKVIDRVLKGISPTGISNEIKYDSNGNPIKTIINNVNPDGVLKDNGNYHIRLKGTEKYITGNFRSNMITIEEDNCNHQHFKVTKVKVIIGDGEEEFYRIQAGIKYLSVIENQLILSKIVDDNTLFRININDNGSYTISPKKDWQKVIGNKENKLFILEKQENDWNNQFYFEDIDTPLFIESKSYYTSDGRFVTCVEDALGKKTKYDVDPLTGLVRKIINSKGIKAISTYNSKYQITSITNNDKIVTYEYNNKNLLSKIKSGTKEYTFTYDNYLNEQNIKLNNNLLIENTYESNNGNLIKSKYGNNFEINYTYDELERIKTLTKGNKTYIYYYDCFGNVTKIIGKEKFDFKYNLANKLTNYKYLNNDNEFKIDYKYNSNNSIINKIYNINDIIVKNVDLEYDEDESVVKTIIDNNNINYNYDYLGRLTSKNINDNLKIEYTYITYGNKTSLVVDTMKVDEDLYKYEYDDLYNITHIYLNNELINEYEYDDINELILEKDYLLNRSYKYFYDKEGNILKKQEYELTTHILIKEDKYEYNNTSWEDQLTKFNSMSIVYDEIGNPLTIENATLTWINGRQLGSYIDTDLNVTYEYDINGIRTSKVVNGEETKYFTEENKIIFEIKPEGVIYYIRDENKRLIGLWYNNITYFYKKNYQGDIIGIYDSNYDLVVNYKYDSWGNIISITDNNENIITDINNIGLINPYRYRSYYYDTETKLYYLNSRYYNPLWGRFINADSLLIQNKFTSLGNNLYLYANNNVVKYGDANGNILSFLGYNVVHKYNYEYYIYEPTEEGEYIIDIYFNDKAFTYSYKYGSIHFDFNLNPDYSSDDAYTLALAFKNLYPDIYNKNLVRNTDSMALELDAHYRVAKITKPIQEEHVQEYLYKHAEVADIGSVNPKEDKDAWMFETPTIHYMKDNSTVQEKNTKLTKEQNETKKNNKKKKKKKKKKTNPVFGIFGNMLF